MILVVDDQLDAGAVLARLLKRCGHEAVAVGSGKAALRMLRTSKPDLIILDMTMPEMDGLAVLRSIQSDAQAKDIPVIVYSADNDLEMVRAARVLGARAYLVKGVTPWADVCATVGRYVAA